MKALVVNAIGHGFDFEDVEIAAPIGREVLVVTLTCSSPPTLSSPRRLCSAMRSPELWQESALMSDNSAWGITSWALSLSRAVPAPGVYQAVLSSASTQNQRFGGRRRLRG